LNSFAKDWKHWSTTERVAAELFGATWICGLVRSYAGTWVMTR